MESTSLHRDINEIVTGYTEGSRTDDDEEQFSLMRNENLIPRFR